MKPENETDRAVAFVRDFIRADLETDVARNMTDAAEYSRRLQALKEFFASDVSPGHPLVISTELDDDVRTALEAQARGLKPRVLFKIKRWLHPREGTIYQAYLSSTAPSKTKGYFESLLVKGHDGRFRIVGRYSVCRACFASGKHGGKRCPDCYAPGWDYREGLKLKTFGKAQETQRFEPPTNTAFLPEYEAD